MSTVIVLPLNHAHMIYLYDATWKEDQTSTYCTEQCRHRESPLPSLQYSSAGASQSRELLSWTETSRLPTTTALLTAAKTPSSGTNSPTDP